jgi:hypothetical protein
MRSIHIINISAIMTEMFETVLNHLIFTPDLKNLFMQEKIFTVNLNDF